MSTACADQLTGILAKVCVDHNLKTQLAMCIFSRFSLIRRHNNYSILINQYQATTMVHADSRVWRMRLKFSQFADSPGLLRFFQPGPYLFDAV